MSEGKKGADAAILDQMEDLENQVEELKIQNKDLKVKSGPTKKLEVIIDKRNKEIEDL